MKVCVRLFARARDLAGQDTVHLEVAAPSTVGQLRRQLAAAIPALRTMLEHCGVAVGSEFANDAVVLPPKAEVAILPPVSGG
jgi:molybdopterin converting factor subunit 1